MKKEILIREAYLYLPIQLGQAEKEECEEKLFEFFVLEEAEDKNQDKNRDKNKDKNRDKIIKERKILEFYIPAGIADSSGYAFDYQARFPVKQFTDKTIVVKGDAPAEFFDEIKNGPYLASEPAERPLHHLTAEYGWMNDPNGLLFDGTLYHAYFQHNPCNIKWNNMSWGHAVSNDLLHWECRDDVLFPDQYGMAFSGCGLMNEKGLLNLPRDAFLFYYTAAGDTMPWCRGKKAAQRFAYSLDHGNTFQKRETVSVDTISWENRDPKIFYHEPSQAYIMVLWVEKNDFGILRSADLQSWELTDRVTLQDAWECPDLLPVPCQNQPGVYQWMFWSADGYYFWGEFDGYRFQTDGVRHNAYLNKVPYAAQTVWGAEEIISIPWLRLEHKNRRYRGAFGIPRELSYSFEEGERVLLQTPFRKWKQHAELFLTAGETADISGADGNTEECCGQDDMEIKNKASVVIEIQLGGSTELHMKVNRMEVHYDKSAGELVAGKEVYRIGKADEFSFWIDDTIFELTVGHGIMTGVFELPDAEMNILIHKGQGLCCRVYELK